MIDLNKKVLLVIFGGQSSEHEVSLLSAKTVIKNIDKNKYEVFMIGITKEGKWLLFEGELNNLNPLNWQKFSKPAILSPDATTKGIFIYDKNSIETKKIDVIFPVLHGLYGEDGSIQGLFELAQIPYVGCGILASSVCMDKTFTKVIVDNIGIKQANYIGINLSEFRNFTDDVLNKIERKIGYECFVKPSNAGSSVGISKVKNKSELIEAINIAFNYDKKVLIEECIMGRELECAVLGNEIANVSDVGEIIPSDDFYSYDAKYNSDDSKTILNPDLDQSKMDEIKNNSLKIFKAVDGKGLARVDFFLENGTNNVIFNEINTLPGFTDISMYPKLWEERGISITSLIDKLIELALQ